MNESGDRLRSLEQRMLGELPGWLRELAALVDADAQRGLAASASCCEQVGHLAHKLRGRAAMLQLSALAAQAARLEASCKRSPAVAELRGAVADCALASRPSSARPGLRLLP